MSFNETSVRKRLKDFAFADLFAEELGWNRHSLRHSVEVAGHTYELRSEAEKADIPVFECAPGPGGRIPDYSTRRQIERRVAKTFVEHLIIFTDAARTTQVWQWMKREKDKPIQSRETTWYPSLPGALVQKLQKLQFTLEEEEQGISIVDSLGRMRDAFDVEKVTKKFYEAFRKEHAAFLDGIEGFPPPVKNKDNKKEPHPDLQWYTSLTLNRLMFVYFIQKKRFLDGDVDYLQNRLKAVRATKGKDKFHSFYRLFLLHLFQEGLGKQEAERDPELAKLIGKVPYLNGGFFEVHQLERDYKEIDIPDKAFARLFAFFDTWDWVLDTRAPRDLSEQTERKDEINPDVVGYIFEKYINQKQMGAYYTKEDITGYITQNTVIPFILDRAAKECAVAFRPDGFAWKLLKDDPDSYIYEPVRRGVIDGKGEVISLPPEIEAGIKEIPKREGWNKPAAAPYALPTETWREHVARRQRCLDLREKLRKGEIHAVNDLITYNLNIRQFAQDIISNCDGPELLKAIWQPLRDVTILDPTCGSGAFLFAALNLLEPLYSGCLDKMQAFIDEAKRLGDDKRLARLAEFKKTLDAIAHHANEDYFVLKSIIVNNLYGVDIMEEAVEICRLRLFLKLVSTVNDAKKIEPLPDIDFNVRAGNTLVGYATKEQSEDNLNFGGVIDRIEEKAKVMDLNWQRFKAAQAELGLKSSFVRAMKDAIKKPLDELRAELDDILAVAYGQAGKDKLPVFRKSHQPFHWWIEFYGIIKEGGFDVIVGNPPYVELKEIDYVLRGFRCVSAGNLYAVVMEQCERVARDDSRLGFIVPVSSISTDRYAPLQRLLQRRTLNYSSYDDRPSRLFDGLEHIRLTIHVLGPRSESLRLSSTRYNKWNSIQRGHLLTTIAYTAARPVLIEDAMPKFDNSLEWSIVEKLCGSGRRLSDFTSKTGRSKIYYSRKVGYFLQVLNFEPRVLDGSGKRRPPSEFKELCFGKDNIADAALCCLNSNLFYWFITTFSDCRHVNKREVEVFPCDLAAMAAKKHGVELSSLAEELTSELKRTSENRVMKFKHDTLTVQCIIPKRAKPVIDRIDSCLGACFKFTDEEIDYIINYDIKYRLGRDAEDEED